MNTHKDFSFKKGDFSDEESLDNISLSFDPLTEEVEVVIPGEPRVGH